MKKCRGKVEPLPLCGRAWKGWGIKALNGRGERICLCLCVCEWLCACMCWTNQGRVTEISQGKEVCVCGSL